MTMKYRELKRKYIDFFISKKHAEIPSASLIPENDPTVLFTTAGMHPLVPFLMGQPHPLGKRLANVQKCVRTDDINDVGDAFHLTFFEMLGNWSLGDYFKKEAIEWSFEFLTSRQWLGIPIEKLSITCFEGDADAPKDEYSSGIWQNLGIPKERIYYFPKKDNWWGPAGTTGPCGPDTEMFYDTDKEKCSPDCKPGCSCGKYAEIWNDVFMEFNKTADGKYEKLAAQCVDTGMGVERTLAVLNGKSNVYETEIFLPVMNRIRSLAKNHNTKSERIIADHMRAATFMLADPFGLTPSNLGRGYVLRRLIRRSIRHGKILGIEEKFLKKIAEVVIEIHRDDYHELEHNKNFVFQELEKEEERFEETLDTGMRHFEKIKSVDKIITGKDAFLLFQSYGFPVEMTKELAAEKGWSVDMEGFKKEYEAHQELSRKSTEGIFKSGLQDHGEMSTRYHTATHLLNQALREVLGEHIVQRGSNITIERMRFDFSHPQKMTADEIKKVENIVNEKIKEGLEVKKEEMTPAEAIKAGAQGVFGAKYGEKVFVYSIGNFSKEICAGPHVSNTNELGHFKIQKEEAIAAGVRRIKAVLE
jgi:alanyl-tRNA synthetase